MIVSFSLGYLEDNGYDTMKTIKFTDKLMKCGGQDETNFKGF